MQLGSSERVNALCHLYRGELARMTAYRLRLDTTTNWALGTTAAMVTFALGHAELPHSVFGLAAMLDVMFLWLEANRFRTYVGIRRRVRLLEEGFSRPRSVDATRRVGSERSPRASTISSCR